MMKKILAFTLVLLTVAQALTITSFAASKDPYAGIDAWEVDSYKCARMASFSVDGKLGGIWPGDWGCYKSVDFGEEAPLAVEVSVGVPEGYSKAVELRIDAPNGTKIATVPVIPGDWAKPVASRVEVETQITGVHDVYITHSSGTSNIFKIKFFKKASNAESLEYSETDAFVDISEDKNRRAINLVNQLGLLKSFENDKFEPLMPVTRGEFVYSIYKLYAPDEKMKINSVSFSDVSTDKYYANAVSFLTGMGMVNGVTEDKFCPDDFIRHLDAVAIICRVLDYGQIVDANGGYPLGYIKAGALQGLFVSGLSNTEYLRRTDMAELLVNAINADCVEVTSIYASGGEAYGKERGILYKTQKISKSKGMVVTNSVTNLYLPESDLAKNEVVIGDEVYKVGKTAATSMLGFECEFFYSEDSGEKILHAITPLKKVVTYKISSSEAEFTSINNSEIVYFIGENKETVELDNAVVIYNGVAADDTVSALVGNAQSFRGAVRVVENSNTTVVFIDEYVNHVAGSVNENESFIKDAYSKESISIDEKTAKIVIKKENETAKIGDISEGDILSVFSSKNKKGDKYIRIYVSNREISGTVTRKDEETVTLAGEEYKISPYNMAEIRLGKSGIFKLDAYGEISDFEYAETNLQVGLYFASSLEKVAMNSRAKIKMCTKGGKTQVFNIAQNAVIDGLRFDEAEEMINGKGTWEGLGRLTAERPVCYLLNEKNEIEVLDTLLKGDNGSKDLLKQLSVGTEIYQYAQSVMANNEAGKFYVPPSATLITFFGDTNKEESCEITLLQGKMNSTTRPKGEVYSTFGDDYSGDVFVWRNYSSSSDYGEPFIFKSISEGLNENGENIRYIKGFDGQNEVIYTLREDDYLQGTLSDIFQNVKIGDVLRVIISPDGLVFNAQIIFFRDAATVRNTVSSTVSEVTRASGTYDRTYRFVYGSIIEKNEDYFVLDTNGDTELIARLSATVTEVGKRAQNNEYFINESVEAKSLSEGDKVFVYVMGGGTRRIYVYKDNVM